MQRGPSRAINGDMLAQGKAPAEYETPPDPAVPGDVGPTDARAERSAGNVLSWTAYLPPDCVEMMVKMGWDHTT